MNPWILVTGWTLIHFVWQGALIALATAAGLRLTRRGSSQARYVIACAGLAAMLASPVVTATLFVGSGAWSDQRGSAAISAAATGLTMVKPSIPGSGVEMLASPGVETANIRLDAFLVYVVWGWLAGVVVLMGRFAGGCWRLHQLRAAIASEAVSRWHAASEQIARRLGVKASFRVVESSLVDAPSAIGWLRPVIVLPVAALANLAPLQIEAILAHELAHVRRHDYAVNLFQTVAETLLFYHPGIWWASARIREEREHCCDDVAVEVCGEPAAYAAALAELASWRVREAALAVGATDGSLLARVHRLISVPGDEPRRSVGALATLALSVLVFAGLAFQSSSQVEADAPAVVQAEAKNPLSAGSTVQPEDPNWSKRTTDHFELHYPNVLDLHAERVAREAERAYERVSADLRHELAFKVPLIIFHTVSGLSPGMQGFRQSVQGVPEPHRGSRDRILLAVDQPPDQWYGLITHEVAHVFAFDIIPGAKTPAWIMEGLAEYERGEWDPNDLAALRVAVHVNQIPTISDLDGARGSWYASSSTFGHAAFDFIESRWKKDGVRKFLFGLRQAALKGADPYETALQMTREGFGSAFEQYLKDRFARTGELAAERFESRQTVEIEGEITSIRYPVAAGLACLHLREMGEGSRRGWSVECGEGAGPDVMRMLKPGDRVIVAGHPARNPSTQRLMMRGLVRESDGFRWRAQPD
jgi:beta-lactamase regulating signal transducer with metallopeptidase domain